jgi:RNA polymerase sigma-70 factor (ECF subfamily)
MAGFPSTVRQPSDRHARIRAMVDDNVDFVARMLRRAGVPPSDLDDEIQRTFMVAADRIDEVQVGAERSFLFQVARNLAWHRRRTLARRREVMDGNLPDRYEWVATPEFLADQAQMQRLFEDIIGTLSETVREVFTLFEVEDMNLTEIAETLGLPRGTVASRLRRARAQFRQHVVAIELADAVSGPAIGRMAEPAPLRRERIGALQRALLTAGASAQVSTSIRARTLSALGLIGPGGRP